MLKDIIYILRILLIYLALSIGCFLMLRIIMGYTSFREDVQFLLFKQNYIHNPIWKTAFYVHVFSAVLALFAGFTQFSNDLFKKHRKLHRYFGHIYIWNILVINVPAGMILAIYANGLLPGKIAFVLLDSLWFVFTYKALVSAYRKDFVAHRDYTVRSYVLTFSAITLRMWKSILSNSFHIDPIELYIIDAWIGFVPNLLVAEWLIRSKKTKDLTYRVKGKA